MRKRGDPLSLVVAALVFISVSKIHAYVPLIGMVQPADLLVFTAFGYWLLRPGTAAVENVTRWWPSRVILALAVLACLSVPFGISLGRAATFFLSSYSKVLVFTALLLGTMRSPAHLRRGVWAFVLGASAIAYISLFMVGISKTSSHRSYDANDTGLFLVTAFPLAIWLFRTTRGRGKAMAALCGGLILWTIPQSESRGAFVAFLAVLAALLVWGSGYRAVRRLGVLLVAALVLVGASPEGYGERIRSLTSPTEDYNWSATNGRKQLAVRGLGYMARYPLFGIGVGNFPMAEGQISEKARNHVPGTGIRWAAAHNSYVQAGAEMGIPGLLLWSSLVFGSIFSLVRLRRRLPRAWARQPGEEGMIYHGIAYLVIAWIGFAVSAVFVSFAYLDPVYILSAFTVGVYVSVAQLRAAGRPAQELPPTRRGPRRRTAAIAAGGPWPAS